MMQGVRKIFGRCAVVMAGLALVVGAVSASVNTANAQQLQPTQRQGQAAPQTGAQTQGRPAAAPPSQAATQPSATAPAETPGSPGTYSLEGFRSARFNMTEAEVIAAIQRDFRLQRNDIRVQDDAALRIRVISATVRDLVPDSGPATLFYLMGHKSQRLFRINVIWTRTIEQPADSQSIVGIGNALRNFFVRQGYRSEGLIVDGRSSDSSIVYFRGLDRDGRMTLLTLSTSSEVQSGDERRNTATLALSYVADPDNLDVFRIDGGF